MHICVLHVHVCGCVYKYISLCIRLHSAFKMVDTNLQVYYQ